jgi:hypothetical protein
VTYMVSANGDQRQWESITVENWAPRIARSDAGDARAGDARLSATDEPLGAPEMTGAAWPAAPEAAR